jgi:ComF family protein
MPFIQTLRRGTRRTLLDLQSFLFPSTCTICDSVLPTARPFHICRPCRARLTPVHGPTCLACRVEGRESRGFAAGRDCRRPEHATFRVYAAVQMVDPADTLVHALKFHDRPELGATLALLIARRLRAERRTHWNAVLPMPLHAARERARGYNQSAEIARRLARSLDAPMVERLLVRRRATKAQADLDYAARALNVSGAFGLANRPRRIADHVAGLRCLVLDDVATTGHTLLEAILALRQGAPAATAAAVFALA